MIRIDKITDRNEFIINNASTRNKLSYEEEKAGWDNIASFIKEAKVKGYDYGQIKELTENILKQISGNKEK
jgi:DNA-binding transcriptional regulator YhcF (GntR family)